MGQSQEDAFGVARRNMCWQNSPSLAETAMFRHSLRWIIRIASSPIVMLIAGMFLSIASAWELGESLFSFREGLKGGHGAFLYGLMTMVKSLGELGEMEALNRYLDESRAKPRAV
jgi:hypothetical protein